MRAIKGARYRVISDSNNFFHPGDIVVALENSVAPYCVREEKYILKDWRLYGYNPLYIDEIEMLEDQPYLEN